MRDTIEAEVAIYVAASLLARAGARPSVADLGSRLGIDRDLVLSALAEMLIRGEVAIDSRERVTLLPRRSDRPTHARKAAIGDAR